MTDLMTEIFREGGPGIVLIAVGLSAVGAIVLKSVLKVVLSKLKKFSDRSATQWDNILVYSFEGTGTWALFVWIAVGFIPRLGLHPSVSQAGHTVFILVSALQIFIWCRRGVRRWRDSYLESHSAIHSGSAISDRSAVAAIGLLATALQGLILIVVVLFAMSNLGIDVMALMAGLGIGGIAVALAAQNILGDIFASLSIVLDKPFVVGDFIAVGDRAGTVENIGLKTTRLRALSGEQLIFSNKDLLESRVQNFKRMWERRVVQKIGVTYSTPVEKLEKIPTWIQELINNDAKLRFDRCHFAAYASSAIDFEFVFFVLSSDFNLFMDRQQALLLGIYRKFAAENVQFAFPTQTIFIEGSEAVERMGTRNQSELRN